LLPCQLLAGLENFAFFLSLAGTQFTCHSILSFLPSMQRSFDYQRCLTLRVFGIDKNAFCQPCLLNLAQACYTLQAVLLHFSAVALEVRHSTLYVLLSREVI